MSQTVESMKPMSNDQEHCVRSYGVKEQSNAISESDRACERLALIGFAVISSGYSSEEQRDLENAFDRALVAQSNVYGGSDRLKLIDEHNTIRAPLLYDDAFLRLAQNANILAIASRMFGGSHDSGRFMLNQQNGIINPGNRGVYNQGSFHRDLPYQHFVSSRPLAINALYCVDPFTIENGATLVVPGSHKKEEFPSDATVKSLSVPVEAPAGSFLVLDCMLFHSGGVNTTGSVRRAVNHVYSLPFIRQQIEFGQLVRNRVTTPALAKLLGFGNESVSSPEDYYKNREARLPR